jgi:RimJ/RimL family protein N-acetyltransferase
MTEQAILTTSRLVIEPLAITDDDFIYQLLNTEGWLQFIGNRNITSRTDAAAYIQRILDNENVAYWVVKLRDQRYSIGIVTLIKRDYLEHRDIGFAFLPGFSGKGYAFEATHAVLNNLVVNDSLTHILATVIPENINSIKLLNKLGLTFEMEIEVENNKLHVYGASADDIKQMTHEQ